MISLSDFGLTRRLGHRCTRSALYITGFVYVACFVALSVKVSDVLVIRFVQSVNLTSQANQSVTSRQKPATVSDEPVNVIILTYQRSGSTFLAQIFNRNPEAFYAFEPLDGLYSAIYGTSEGFNSPSDIVQFWNGTQRRQPDFEVESSARVLQDLLSCRHGDLPTEMLLHTFWAGYKWQHLALDNFTKCFGTEIQRLTPCKATIRSMCAVWFGEPRVDQTRCRNALWSETGPKALNAMPKQFQRYRRCADIQRTKAKYCFPHMTKVCNESRIRSTKVVRLSMSAAELLLQSDPDTTRIIHLIRDPKAVVLSRMKYESVRSHYAKQDKVKEAKVLCRTIHEDLILRESLETLYPERIHQIIYEEFVSDPIRNTKDIYNFIRKQLPQPVLEFLENETSTNGMKYVVNLTLVEIHAIDHECRDVYKALNYTWALPSV